MAWKDLKSELEETFSLLSGGRDYDDGLSLRRGLGELRVSEVRSAKARVRDSEPYLDPTQRREQARERGRQRDAVRRDAGFYRARYAKRKALGKVVLKGRAHLRRGMSYEERLAARRAAYVPRPEHAARLASRREEAELLLRGGATWRQTGALLGMSQATVSKAGKGLRRQGRPAHPPEVRERVRALRAQRLSYPKIAAETGLPLSTVYRLAQA